ncbi:ComC/BlpC family leader-containing pheromone/bacteriocin [Lactococcus hircilactis]|uniref:ComC/BlpC family leader-containing pheromone/bacteriocin n=1 Tax=Lactococcus hircilactis TaxID=1494462 RepID=UPI003FA1E1BF
MSNNKLDMLFMEQFEELTDKDLANVSGGSGYKNSGMSKSTYDFLTWLGDMAEGVPYYS